MGVIKSIQQAVFYLNYLRTIPVYVAYKSSTQRDKIKMDLDRWRDVTSDRCVPEKSDLRLMNRLLMSQIPFRNLIQKRFRTPPYTVSNVISYYVASILWKKDSTLYISTHDIGGGLFIQHGFSTVIDAESIGENCWINQQVTIGYSGAEHPIIGDNCRIHCGAKVLGGITMHNGSVAGANAVVVKDVPENAVVGGVPAKVIKYRQADEA